ncbi:MAG: GNAT family N-acetyltransferase [Akkermansiaceae bacterium]|nr:GNAT family N-acetyltransferase [Akkermansiaceae bacterium]NNM29739.1 GNAT family N-acetyltransferase [Akkermansiaceae bacterium]
MDRGTDTVASGRGTGASGDLAIRAVDPGDDSRWDREVSRHADGSVFHSAAWARVVRRTYGHRPCSLRVSQGDTLVALVPLMEVGQGGWRRGVSMPFSDAAGPLIFHPRRASAVWSALESCAEERRWKRLELRGGPAPRDLPAAFRYEGFRLDLSAGIDRLHGGFDGSVRRAIRKAERCDLRARVERDLAAMRTFYELHARTRRRHGLPPQPWTFFRNLHEEIIAPGNGAVVLAEASRQSVAGAVFLWSGPRAIFKYGASLPEAWPLRPNQFTMWAGIRHLVETGCRVLDLGRTSATQEGLLRFKRAWGAAPQPLDYYRYECPRRAWAADLTPPREGYPALFGWMPLGVNRLAGKLIYRHLD